jgi:hypothetical protein
LRVWESARVLKKGFMFSENSGRANWKNGIKGGMEHQCHAAKG